MSVSTNGILFYGFPVDDESADHERIHDATREDDYEDWVAKLYGWDGASPRYAFEWEKQNPSPVTVGLHCSDGFTMYYVAIEQSEVVAHRGYPELVERLEAQPDWNDKLDDFCKRAGLTKPERYGWYVASWWC